MSTIPFTRRQELTPGNVGAALVGAIGLIALGLVCGRLASSHYAKLAVGVGIGIPAVGLLGTLIYRRPVLAAVGLGASLVAIPSYAAPTVLHLAVHPVLVLSLLAAVVLILRAVVGRRGRLSTIDVCVGLFTVAICLGVVLGPRTWKEASAQLWIWLAAYTGGRVIAGNRKLRRPLAQTLAIGGALLTPFSIAEAAGLGNPFFKLGTGSAATTWAHPDIRAGESFRVETAFGHPIAFSMFLAVAAVFALVLIGQATTRRERLFYTGTLAALLVQEAMTRSRSGWVVLGVAVLLLAAGRRRGRAEQAARRAIVGGVGVLLAFAVAIPSVAAVPLSLVGLQSDTADSAVLNGSANYRSGLYSAAFSNGVASLFGNKTSKLSNSVQLGNQSVDSEYLLLLDQWGGVATLAFLLVAVALTAKSLSDQGDEWESAFTVAAVGSMVALASVALITQQEYLVWLLIGLAAAPKRLPTALPHLPRVPIATAPGGPAPTAPGVPQLRERTNLDAVLAVVRRRWWILVLCPMIVGGGAYVVAKQQPVKYTASSSLLFGTEGLDRILTGTSLDKTSRFPARRAATIIGLATLPAISQLTAAQIPGLGANRIRSEVKISQVSTSDMYLVKVTDRSAARAALIATTYARAYLTFRTQTERAQVAVSAKAIDQQIAAMSPASRESPAGQQLQARADRLALLGSLQHGGAELAAVAATPQAPSSPHTSKTAKYGVIIGLALGFVLLFWLGRRDRRIRDPASIEDAYGLPLLGTVTDEQAATLGDALISRSAATADAFDLFRASLRYFHRSRYIQTVVVTSAGAREGRTTVALQLAIAEAMAGNTRVLLLEADLRRPTLAAALGTPRAPGLTEVLRGETSYDEAIHEVHVGVGEDGTSEGMRISLLAAGAVPRNPLELLEGAAMIELLEVLTHDYDLVVLDSPALSLVPDALPLLNNVSGVVVAGRIGITTRQSARTLRDQLVQAGAPSLGVVATSVPASRRRRWRPTLRGRRWGIPIPLLSRR